MTPATHADERTAPSQVSISTAAAARNPDKKLLKLQRALKAVDECKFSFSWPQYCHSRLRNFHPYLIVFNSPPENTGKVNFSVFTNLLEAMDMSLEKEDLDRIKRQFCDRAPQSGGEGKVLIRFKEAVQ